MLLKCIELSYINDVGESEKDFLTNIDQLADMISTYKDKEGNPPYKCVTGLVDNTMKLSITSNTHKGVKVSDIKLEDVLS